jgi:DNA-binding protein H-NS
MSVVLWRPAWAQTSQETTSQTLKEAMSHVGAELRTKNEMSRTARQNLPDEMMQQDTLAHIFTASDKPIIVYRNLETGATFNGRGKKPAWLKGNEAKYEVKAA